MIGTAHLEKILTLALFTGYLKGELPVSLLIIAAPEEGKSELSKKFSTNRGIVFPHDVTAYGLIKSYGPRLVPGHKKPIRHIIFPEFIHCLERQRETVKTLLAFLNGLVAEGVKEIHTFRTNFSLPEPMTAGVIACLTTGEFGSWQNYWGRSGFLSRFLPITYSYSVRVENQIFEAIFDRKYRHDPPLLVNLPDASVEVKLTRRTAEQLKPQAKQIALEMAESSKVSTRGFRTQSMLQRLAMAAALSEGREQVTQEDIDLILSLASEHINMSYKEI